MVEQTNVIMVAAHEISIYLLDTIMSSFAAPEPSGWKNLMVIYIDKCNSCLEVAINGMKRFKDKIIVIEGKKKRNQYVGLNTIIKTTPFATAYSVIDSDDYVLWPRWRGILPELDIHHFMSGLAINMIENEYKPMHEIMKKNKRKGIIHVHPAQSITRELVMKIGGYRDSHRAADCDLARRAEIAGYPLKKTRVLAIGRRIHNRQITDSVADRTESIYLLQNKWTQEYKQGKYKTLMPIETDIAVHGDKDLINRLIVMPSEKDNLKMNDDPSILVESYVPYIVPFHV